MKKNIILTALASTLLASCGIYSHYERPTGLPLKHLYQQSTGDSTVQADSTSIASLPWKEVYTDTLLQKLIEQGLKSNTNLQQAKLRIEQAEATLRASKLAFLPSVAFTPQASLVNVTNSNLMSKSYELPLTAQWQADIFGSLRNAKKRNRALVEASTSYKQAIESQLVASIARSYYALVLLDEQLKVNEKTVLIWRENVRTMQALMNAGAYNDAGVSSAEAQLHNVEASVVSLKQQIREAENAIGSILGTANPHIERGSLSSWSSLKQLTIGLPVQLLSQRPDVRRAENVLASSFYAVNEARAAMYPNTSISGNLSSSGIFGGNLANPVLSLIGSLTQPIFAQGRLSANLKIAKSQYQENLLSFAQTIVDAGIEVNNHLSQVQTYHELAGIYRKHTAAVRRSEKATRLLQESGSSTYLEVLTAQQNLLTAELQELSNKYNEIASTIALYQALGGGYSR